MGAETASHDAANEVRKNCDLVPHRFL